MIFVNVKVISSNIQAKIVRPNFIFAAHLSNCLTSQVWNNARWRSRLQPLRGDPDTPPKGTNAIAQARTPQLQLEKIYIYLIQETPFIS